MIKISAIGFLAALHWVTFYGSIKSANVSVALVCFSSVGFFTAILEPLFFRKRLIPLELFLGVLVIVGIYIIFHFDPRYKAGILLGVISAILISIVIILIREFVQRINPQTVVTYQLTGGCIALSFVIPFYLQQFPTNYIFPDTKDWLWLLFLSWICSVLAFQLSARALKKLSAFTVNLSFILEPVYGIALAFIVFGESKDVNWSFFLGFTLIMLAVFLQTFTLWWKARRGRKIIDPHLTS